MVFKCSKCGSVFEEKRRLEIHKQTHDRKSKISEYGSPELIKIDYVVNGLIRLSVGLAS